MRSPNDDENQCVQIVNAINCGEGAVSKKKESITGQQMLL